MQDREGLSDWMHSRQTAFREFERRAFQGPQVPLAPLHLHPLSVNNPQPRQALLPPPSMLSSSPLVRSSEPVSKVPDLNPKARVTYDESRFQVEFDVPDFRPEELSIKTEGDVLVVLAKHETKTDTGASFVSRQFEQRFTLPSGVRPENISSSLSKDGRLIVSAPRDVSKAIVNSSNSRGVVHSSEVAEQQGLPHPRVKYDDDQFQITLDCRKYRPEELDVKVEGNTIIITAQQESKESSGTRTRVFEQKFTLPNGVRADKVASTLNRDGILAITAPRSNNFSTNTTTTNNNFNTKSLGSPSVVPMVDTGLETRLDKALSSKSWSDDVKRRDDSLRQSLFDRSLATNDPFFNQHERSLMSAPSPSLGSGGANSRVVYEDDKYKILVDVHDFKPEELIIKTVGNTVHFEASHEEKTSDGHSFSSRNISQSFTLPRGINPESVTSSLAKDGTLTISAPLPPALRAPAPNERLVPIKHS